MVQLFKIFVAKMLGSAAVNCKPKYKRLIDQSMTMAYFTISVAQLKPGKQRF
jgi:hypothetical protein